MVDVVVAAGLCDEEVVDLDVVTVVGEMATPDDVVVVLPSVDAPDPFDVVLEDALWVDPHATRPQEAATAKTNPRKDLRRIAKRDGSRSRVVTTRLLEDSSPVAILGKR
jgi:hypothetical protein